MGQRALESSALSGKILPVSPASLILVAELVLAWLQGSYRAYAPNSARMVEIADPHEPQCVWLDSNSGPTDRYTLVSKS